MQRLIVTIMILSTGPYALGAIPLQLNHQGIVEVNGSLFNGSGSFRFALVDPDSGNNLWTNDGSNVPGPGTPTAAVSLLVINGIYNVGLGDTSLPNMTSIQSSVFDDDNVVLRIWFDDGINGSGQLSPDHVLTSAPYAMHAAVAESVPWEGITNKPPIVGSGGAFGNGKDGDFTVSSGTTLLEQGRVYHFTSLTVAAGATISAASTSNKPMIVYVQGNAQIDGTIDLKGKGSTESYLLLYRGDRSYPTIGAGRVAGLRTNDFGLEVVNQPGAAGLITWNLILDQWGFVMNGTHGANGAQIGYDQSGIQGAGGGGGASSINNGVGGVTQLNEQQLPYGLAGNGGCTLLMIVGGNVSFGASAVIDVSGEPGTDGNGAASPGGGGGGSGDILIFYNGSMTDNGLTASANGGAGGNVGGGAGGAGQVKIAPYDTVFWGN